MNLLVPVLIGIFFAASAYLVLRKNVLKLVVGLGLLSHATNLILLAGGMNWTPESIPNNEKKIPIIASHHGDHTQKSKSHAPLSAQETKQELEQYRDPVPQALVLTAIVISFGVTALQLVLALRIYRETRIVNMHELKEQRG